MMKKIKNPILKNFDIVVKNIKEMIKENNPPVVSFVAIKTKDPFKILISTILSARTRDEATMEAFKRLFNDVNSPKDLAEMPLKKIESLIKPVGFYRNKAKHIKETARIIHEKYHDQVPRSIEELITLPGVGLKTATLVLIEAFNENEICVDTHVHRISNRWKIVNTKTPIETYYELKKILPKKYWKDYNFLLVSFGQSICKPIKPKCDECKIKQFCPYYQKIRSK